MSCLICFETFDSEIEPQPASQELDSTSSALQVTKNFSVTTCGHLFHTDCFNDWKKHSRDARCAFCSAQDVALIRLYQNFTPLLKRPEKLKQKEVLLIESGDQSAEVEMCDLLDAALKRVDFLEDEIEILKVKLSSLISEDSD
ncbi:hypothetical protein DSO57_1004507 [Entomophthora muscae]|uniref:Uncharacterized protein n=1 Tax=Entomophthora muscae TaxID=34485 RepID=A0ACC2RMW1_9FUNG|nr:hypothetical protein DSO57_1004507 [Entomophthora muscae]